ncbi:MAG: response regulator (CheY-like receiver domain and AraC-type DNA-binding domain containing protein) [Solidesulfovibrio magneticus str. Maddingley MBC34]|uniref:Response regulator (CheY-like receiver domain and AraC-type DNA-binding domain containing protein) n=1 Tax=Solidesulfovibrio magneticus str. Maddingley MBC34 TaxID=1206767 RepID=K6GHZ3_9BACT|nr:MAG: response regulator (CheY-like receiver domain and AraC-type DNA-binding domain containing protein) [Solidesulfovibrio magneticus str. Maddingley MBC34]
MKSLRILVVDDSGLTVKKMAKLLEELGHQVVGMASTGQQAVDVYAEAAPDVTTMDITMPDMDGIEATRRILAVHPGACIVIVTSHGQEQMVMDAIEAGAKGYILKPVKQEKLAETLETVAAKYL